MVGGAVVARQVLPPVAEAMARPDDFFGNFMSSLPGEQECCTLRLPEGSPVLAVTFEALIEQTINQPDDRAASRALQEHVTSIIVSGRLEEAMQVVLTLAAHACLHPELEGAATQAGNELESAFVTERTSSKHCATSGEADDDKGSKDPARKRRRKKKTAQYAGPTAFSFLSVRANAARQP